MIFQKRCHVGLHMQENEQIFHVGMCIPIQSERPWNALCNTII
jgi:hypothetical protein